MTTRFFSGASIFALLIVEICCLPVKSGFDPTYGSAGGPSFAAPNYGTYQGAPSIQSPPSFGPPEGGFYQPTGAAGTGSAQPAPYRILGAPVGSGSVSSGQSGAVSPLPASIIQTGPAVLGGPEEIDWTVQPSGFLSGTQDPADGSNVASSGPENVSPAPPVPAGIVQTGPSFQNLPEEIYWAVEPPSFLSATVELPVGSHGGSSSGLEDVSLTLPAGGQLARYEGNLEHGDSARETEAQGSGPSPAAIEYSSGPLSYVGGNWGFFPYDYMLMTGQYPTGTFSQSSSSYEQGRDDWQDVHYLKYHIPLHTYTEVRPVRVPMQPVKRPVKQPVKGKGGY